MGNQGEQQQTRVVQRDLTVVFGTRLYSLAHLGSAMHGARVKVSPVAGTESICVEIAHTGIRARHILSPIRRDEFGFRADASVIGA